MVYRVSLSALAENDVYSAFERIRETAPLHAEAWLRRLFAEIATLERMPLRCPIITEAEELGFEARHLMFGKRKGAYRIIFHVLENKRQVRVLRVWHSARQALLSADIDDL